MLESFSTGTLDYEKLTPEEQKRRGILGRLVGVIADYKNPTRNGRKYSEKLWEKVFNDKNSILREKILNKCAFGELGHPPDRTEVDMEKVALCLAEMPKKGQDGCLYGVFDILDTPNGRILKCLCDYGCNIGVSSRGEGDITVDENGEDAVDPQTFQCECWDAVLVPAVEQARLQYVTESVNSNVSLQEQLNTLLNSANADDRKVMNESLDLVLNSNKYSQEATPVNIEAASSLAVVDNEAQDMMLQQLQESLKVQQKLSDNISTLQEQLSVSYAKETKYQEEIETYKKAISKLKEAALRYQAAQSKVKNLTEELNGRARENNELRSINERTQSRLLSSTQQKQELSALYEQYVSKTDSTISDLTTKLKQAQKSLVEAQQKNSQETQRLIESQQEKIKDFQIKQKELDGKVAHWKQVAEKYQKIALKAVDRYIESKAVSLGISANEIKNKLSQNYTFTDIDKICEDLRQYKLSMSNLPFNSRSISKQLAEGSTILTASSKKDSILPKMVGYEDVDEVDEQLINLAGI